MEPNEPGSNEPKNVAQTNELDVTQMIQMRKGG